VEREGVEGKEAEVCVHADDEEAADDDEESVTGDEAEEEDASEERGLSFSHVRMMLNTVL
jgi:hypothetical protein